MPTLISCELSAATAVRLGLPSAGRHTVAMDAATLAGLTAEEREALRPFVFATVEEAIRAGYGSILSLVAESTPAGVVESLRARISTAAAEEAAKQAKSEQQIAHALAAPIADWIASDGSVLEFPSGNYLTEDQRKDPRVKARRTEILASPERQAAVAAHEAKERVERETEERAKKEAVEKSVRKQAERDAWIRVHGSERLRLGLQAGLVDSLETVYLEERLAIEMTGWIRGPISGPDFTKPHNPSEEALRVLIDARVEHPNAQVDLYYQPHYRACDEDACDDACQSGLYLVATWRGEEVYRAVG